MVFFSIIFFVLINFKYFPTQNESEKDRDTKEIDESATASSPLPNSDSIPTVITTSPNNTSSKEHDEKHDDEDKMFEDDEDVDMKNDIQP